jgi:hypothetical protein
LLLLLLLLLAPASAPPRAIPPAPAIPPPPYMRCARTTVSLVDEVVSFFFSRGKTTCQLLSLCTSKASKVSVTFARLPRVRARWVRVRCNAGYTHTAYVSIRQHTSAYVSIRHTQHTSRVRARWVRVRCNAGYTHTAYVSIRQHASAYVTHSIRHACVLVGCASAATGFSWLGLHTHSIRQHTSAYVLV